MEEHAAQRAILATLRIGGRSGSGYHGQEQVPELLADLLAGQILSQREIDRPRCREVELGACREP